MQRSHAPVGLARSWWKRGTWGDLSECRRVQPGRDENRRAKCTRDLEGLAACVAQTLQHASSSPRPGSGCKEKRRPLSNDRAGSKRTERTDCLSRRALGSAERPDFSGLLPLHDHQMEFRELRLTEREEDLAEQTIGR